VGDREHARLRAGTEMAEDVPTGPLLRGRVDGQVDLRAVGVVGEPVTFDLEGSNDPESEDSKSVVEKDLLINPPAGKYRFSVVVAGFGRKESGVALTEEGIHRSENASVDVFPNGSLRLSYVLSNYTKNKTLIHPGITTLL